MSIAATVAANAQPEKKTAAQPQSHQEQLRLPQGQVWERWVEFVQGGEVKGRALAPAIPAAESKQLGEATPPQPDRARVERLREDQYYRVWFNHRGDQILIYLPMASRAEWRNIASVSPGGWRAELRFVYTDCTAINPRRGAGRASRPAHRSVGLAADQQHSFALVSSRFDICSSNE